MSTLFNRATWLKAADATAGAFLCLVLSFFEFLFGRAGPAHGGPADIRRVLVIRPGGMGDMIILMPVLKMLHQRFPRAIVDVACERRNVDVLRLGGMENATLVYDSHPFRFLRRLFGTRYDVALDTEQFHHFSAVFARFSRARVRIGFKVNPRRNSLYTHLITYSLDGPEGLQFMRLVEPIGIVDQSYRLAGIFPATGMDLPAALEKQLADTLGANPFVVMHPGASTVYKLWRPRRFVELSKILHVRHGLGIVTVGSRRDAGLSSRILEGAIADGTPALSCAGGRNLATTAAVIRRARLFVGSDSGLAHLAVALGVPTVVLFGPSDPVKWGFTDTGHAVVRRDLPCAPCFMFGYHKPCRHAACMDEIGVEEVAAACERVLGS